MKEHLIIQSDFDNLPLDTIIMAPNHPKGIIQFAHGMCEHKERYFHFIEYLCQNGYVCIIHDHRGHGKSIYHEDDLGFFYENGHKGIVEDLPLYLFGHSMGSLVVRCYLKQYDQDIDGLFVCGSPSRNPAAKMGILLARTISKLKHNHHRSALIQKIGFGAFNKKFGTTPNSWICSDVEIVNAYNKNPLCRFTFTTNGFESLFHLMEETYSPEKWQINHQNIPIHFIAGEDDPCIQNEKKFKEAVNFIKQCGYTNVTSYLFKGMRHEILNEKDNQKVYQHVIDTLKAWE
ncbi:MAG: alpha/beta hydrolase [Coprobacillus sp.]